MEAINRTEEANWKGVTGGGTFGQRTMCGMLRFMDVRLLYAVLYVVIPFYLLFAYKRARAIYHYFRNAQHYGGFRAGVSTYRQHILFGKMLLDRFAIYAGGRGKVHVEVDGQEFFDQASDDAEKACLVLQSHVGSAEIAGYVLGRPRKQMNCLIFAGESETVQQYRSKMFDTFGIRLIPAQNDLDYLLHINQALSQNEILLLSADRFTEEARTAEMSFMGMTALFPTAPFRLAVNRSTRMLALFVMREKRLSYKVYVRQLSAEGESKEERVKSLMQKYVEQLEEMVRQYPLQWCNFYEFWEEVVQFPLDQLLPQRPPFVMIDRLTQFSETDTETRFKVRSSNLFVEDGVLSVPGITENIAQTCAARLGYWNLINHRAVDIGFIGAIRNLTVKHYPKVGTRISTHIHIEGTAMGMTLVHAVSRSEKEIVAECDMKIAVQEQSDKEKI